jgi:hypothetical protein
LIRNVEKAAKDKRSKAEQKLRDTLNQLAG